MKHDEVEVGNVYETKVGTRTVEVRVVRSNKGGWDATSVATGKPVRVKDASRLKAVKAPVADEGPQGGADAPVKATVARKAKAPKADAPIADKAPGKMSCLDAAAAVLKEAGEPLQTKVMIDRMHTKGLWSSDAPTPAATLYSAILRELKTKGDAARFKKTGRGHFGLSA